jgi:hypothetical protein
MRKDKALELLADLSEDFRTSIEWAERDSGSHPGYCSSDFAHVAERSCASRLILKKWLERIDFVLKGGG